MDIFLIILGSICLLVGLAGCIVPMLPGPPVSYLALVFLHFTDKVSFYHSTTILLVVHCGTDTNTRLFHSDVRCKKTRRYSMG